MNTFKVGVVIARFQPLLKGQIEHLLKPATENSDLVVILLGSSGRARTCVDPLTNLDRQSMIEQSLVGNKTPLVFEPIRDFFYAETPVDWITQVQSAVNNAIKHRDSRAVDHRIRASLGYSKLEIKTTLYGAESQDDIKEYHDWFPQWNIDVAKIAISDLSIDALHYLFMLNEDALEKLVSFETHSYLRNWMLNTVAGKRLREEFRFVAEYKQRTQTGKYPTIFQTVDNVVYYKGNVLLVKRRSQPGKGLWALPGGFLNHDETLKAGAVRELLEETKLRVRPEWLVSKDTFGHPRRSVRGRTITNAFLWKIPDTSTFPRVTAGSDAARVKWFPLAQVTEEMYDQLFEDHLDIIGTLTKRL
jgi:bifunctional NMN adenylyltransferase/nudix hydrolase